MIQKVQDAWIFCKRLEYAIELILLYYSTFLYNIIQFDIINLLLLSIQLSMYRYVIDEILSMRIIHHCYAILTGIVSTLVKNSFLLYIYIIKLISRLCNYIFNLVFHLSIFVIPSYVYFHANCSFLSLSSQLMCRPQSTLFYILINVSIFMNILFYLYTNIII